MFKALLVVVTMLAMGGQADASEKWSAIGILTTQVKGEDARAEYVEIDDFETQELCKQVVNRESHSDDYIGKGGTNGKVPQVQWNYDANCVQKRH